MSGRCLAALINGGFGYELQANKKDYGRRNQCDDPSWALPDFGWRPTRAVAYGKCRAQITELVQQAACTN